MPVVALNIAMSMTIVIAVHGHWRGFQFLVQIGITTWIPGGVVRAQAPTAWLWIFGMVWMNGIVYGFVFVCVWCFFFQFPISYNIKYKVNGNHNRFEATKVGGIWSCRSCKIKNKYSNKFQCKLRLRSPNKKMA